MADDQVDHSEYNLVNYPDSSRATGQWSIYSVQKDLEGFDDYVWLGRQAGAHNYLELVDPNGKIVEEMHGVPQNEATGVWGLMQITT